MTLAASTIREYSSRMFHALALSIAAAVTAAPDAPDLLQRILDAHGSSRLRNATLSFDFRDESFRAERRNGQFVYERQREREGARERDVVSNAGFSHEANGVEVALDADKRRARSESVNSVVYFASLPLALADPAVRLRLLDQEEIEGRSYHRLEVTFDEEGGGADHDDRFLYWFDAESYTMDFLAYRYSRNGGGVRFRVAKNPRTINGVRIQDYDNYAPPSLNAPLESLPARWRAGELKQVSEILTERACVTAAGKRRCE